LNPGARRRRTRAKANVEAATVASMSEDLKRIRAALWGKIPFISSLLGRARIVATESINTAGVDIRTWIHINPRYWASLNFLQKVYLASHEVCLTEGTQVITSDGLKPIQEVKPGELVYNRNGEFTRVINTFKRPYCGEVVEVTPTYGEKVTLTPTHKILTRKVDYKLGTGFVKSIYSIPCDHGIKYPINKRTCPRFTESGLLKRHDALVFPVPKSQRKNGRERLPGYRIRRHYAYRRVNVDGDIAYFLGWFVADGHLSKRSTPVLYRKTRPGKSEREVTISAALNNDISRLVRIIEQKLHRNPCVLRQPNVVRVKTCSVSLARFLRRHCYQGTDKKIPRWLVTAPRNVIEEFVRGLVEGDGYRYPTKNRISLTSVYPGVYGLLPLLLLRLGKQPSIKDSGPGSAGFPNRRPSKTISWQETRVKHGGVIAGRRWMVPAKKVNRKEYQGYVYNLETREGSYTAPFLTVHNCHAGFLHCPRMVGKVPKVFNFAADAVVYVLLEQLMRCPENDYVTPEIIAKATEVGEDKIRKMSVEEVYELLMKNVKVITVSIGGLSGNGAGNDLFPEKPGNGDTVVIQTGAPAFSKSPSETKEAWKQFVSQAYISQRTAGTVPAGLERAVNELIKPAIDPRSLIRQAVRTGLGKLLISDWKRQSRRYPGALPGVKRLTVPTIWPMVDCSGSMGEKDIALALGAVFEFARHARINAISFDTEAYERVAARRPSEVITKISKGMKGGGGTMIQKALERTLQDMKYKDVVLVLTDGAIYDLDKPEVRQLFARLASRASVCGFLTIDAEPQIDRWRVINLRARGGG